MCVAVPGRIEKVLTDKKAVVDFMGIRKEVAIDLLSDCLPGDYVIVHAGFAIQTLNQEEAIATLNCIRELRQCIK